MALSNWIKGVSCDKKVYLNASNHVGEKGWELSSSGDVGD